jgi:hypothetical protein
MHVICAERFFSDPASTYADVLRFLGLPDPPSAPGFKAYNARPAAGMAAGTRERLEQHYAEPNRRLEEFLGMRMGWPAGERDRAER